MLDDLRKKQKLVIYIVAVAFILTGAGGAIFGLREGLFGKKNYLGKVNGEKITIQQFQARLEEAYEQARSQGREIDDNTRRQFQNQVWDQLVNEILIKQQLKKHRIKVSDNEIVTAIQNNPPEELMQWEQLQTNGRFDKSKYLDALKNDINFYAMMENYMRSYLPHKKLEEKIRKDANITLDSLKVEYDKETNKIDGKALWFDINKSDPVNVSDAEVRAY